MPSQESDIAAFLRSVRDPVGDLVRSAARWFADTLNAWAVEDYERVAALAPLAIEHLGKAVLWDSNPVLLVPLTPNAEQSLFELAIDPNLASPKLRTIELRTTFARVERLLGGLPIDQTRRNRIVETRNGAMHVASSPPSRHILTDCLRLAQAFLVQLDRESPRFYGEHSSSVDYLLGEQLNEVQHRVAAKRARARQSLLKLERELGTEIFQSTTNSLELAAADAIDPTDHGPDFVLIAARCPECGSTGRLLGSLDLDAEIGYEVEHIGDGDYIADPVFGGWDASLLPYAFICNVCKLTLGAPDELGEVGLPAASYKIDIDELGDDFDPEYFLEKQRYR